MATPLSPAVVVLIGMMGSGKTAVGRELAARTTWPYLDNDELVRRVTGRQPQEIDATHGEAVLHAAEADALRHAMQLPPPLIAGAAAWVVADPTSVALLTAASSVVYLRATAETLQARIGSGAGRRDDATDIEWLRTRLAERDETYCAVASVTIDTDELTTTAVALRILEVLGKGAN